MKRKWIASGLLIACVLGAAWVAGSQFSLQSLGRQEDFVRHVIREHPIQAWIGGFFLYLLVSLVPGTRGKAVVCGWLFGFLPGVILVNGALTGAALLGFSVSRRFLRDDIASRYVWQLERVNRALDSDGAFYVILLRVIPVSFSFTNYLLGATTLRRKTFWWATQLGLLPGILVFVNVGSRLPSLAELSERGWTAILSWDVVASVGILSLFTLGAPFVMRRFLRR